MNILTIVRSKWRRGGFKIHNEKFGVTRLLNDQGLMCCLGFDALACGFTPLEILNRIDPESMAFGDKPLLNGYSATRLDIGTFMPRNKPPVQEAITINDSDNITDGEREEALHLVFRRLGYDGVVFVD